MSEEPARIKLESISVENFKSFGGEALVGPFGNLTALVGRNGSGKSNFLDAIAFLLGARHGKLRVKNQSELHNFENSLACSQNGTQNVSSVSAKFTQNDGSSVSFTRKLVDVTCTVLFEQLKDLGLDITRSNCLVFQNTVESFLTFQKQEFLSFFEQIAGVSALKTEELAFRNEMTLQRRREIALKGQLAELVKRLPLSNLQDMDQKREHFASLLYEERRRLLLFQLYHAAQDFSEVPSDFAEEENQLVAAKSQCQEQHELCETREAELKAVEDDIRRTETDVSLQKKVVEEIRQRIRENGAKLTKANATYEKSLSTFEYVTNEISCYKEQLEALQGQVAMKAAEIALAEEAGLNPSDEIMAQIREAETAFLAHVPELQELKSQSLLLEVSEKQVQNCKEQVEWNEKDLTVVLKKISSLEEDLRQISKEMSQNIASMTVEAENLDAEVQWAQENTKRVEDELSSLHRRLTLYEENKNDKRKNERVEQLQRTFGTKAVLGRFVNLVSTKKAEHHLALTRAAGQYNDAVVVDTMTSAKRCIEYIKKQLWNRVLFLPLDKLPLTPSDWSQHLPTQKPYRPLVSLLDYDSALEPAVKYVLGKTILCEDFDDAAEVASRIRALGGNMNVVSGNGTLFRSSGLITGGQGNLSPVGKRGLEQLKQRKHELFDELRKIKAGLQQQSALKRLTLKMDAMNLRSRTLETTERETDLKLNMERRKKSELEETLEKRKQELKNQGKNLAKCRATVLEMERIRDEKVQALQQTPLDFTHGMGLFEFKTKCVELRKLKDDIRLLEASDCSVENRLKGLENQLAKEKENSARWENIRAKLGEDLSELETMCNRATQTLQEQQETLRGLENTLLFSRSALKSASDLQESYESQLHLAERTLDRLILTAARAKSLWRKELRNVILESKENEIDLGIESADEVLSSEDVSDTRILNSYQFDFTALPANLLLLRRNPDRNAHGSSARERIAALERRVRDCTVPAVYQDLYQGAQEKRKSVLSELKVARDAFRNAASSHVKTQARIFGKTHQVLDFVSKCLNPIYTELYGNDAVLLELLYATEGDLREQGVALICNPPQKRPMLIHALSGGEKTLASLAVIFALQKYWPSPVMVLDEVDAALDKKRVANLMAFLQRESRKKQIVMISHKLDVLERTDTLLGLYRQMDTRYSTIASLRLHVFLAGNGSADAMDQSSGHSEPASSL